jgi:hypothetical protein
VVTKGPGDIAATCVLTIAIMPYDDTSKVTITSMDGITIYGALKRNGETVTIPVGTPGVTSYKVIYYPLDLHMLDHFASTGGGIAVVPPGTSSPATIITAGGATSVLQAWWVPIT